MAFALLSLPTPSLLGIAGNAAAQMEYWGTIKLWFEKRRGLAFEVVMAEAGLGSIVLPGVRDGIVVEYMLIANERRRGEGEAWRRDRATGTAASQFQDSDSYPVLKFNCGGLSDLQ